MKGGQMVEFGNNPTMEDILKTNLKHHIELKVEARIKFEKAEKEFVERINRLDESIQKIQDDLKRTDGDNYPDDGKFFPPQDW
tara:strand:- start:542 stop:790 length:249 start_codon:yes stop_codon:yes gene_type:complete